MRRPLSASRGPVSGEEEALHAQVVPRVSPSAPGPGSWFDLRQLPPSARSESGAPLTCPPRLGPGFSRVMEMTASWASLLCLPWASPWPLSGSLVCRPLAVLVSWEAVGLHGKEAPLL